MYRSRFSLKHEDIFLRSMVKMSNTAPTSNSEECFATNRDAHTCAMKERIGLPSSVGSSLRCVLSADTYARLLLGQ